MECSTTPQKTDELFKGDLIVAILIEEAKDVIVLSLSEWDSGFLKDDGWNSTFNAHWNSPRSSSPFLLLSEAEKIRATLRTEC
jgi:hypothetical protein